MNDTAHHGTAPGTSVGGPQRRTTSFARMSVIWARAVARSWRSGIRDLYSHIP